MNYNRHMGKAAEESIKRITVEYDLDDVQRIEAARVRLQAKQLGTVSTSTLLRSLVKKLPLT